MGRRQVTMSLQVISLNSKGCDSVVKEGKGEIARSLGPAYWALPMKGRRNHVAQPELQKQAEVRDFPLVDRLFCGYFCVSELSTVAALIRAEECRWHH